MHANIFPRIKWKTFATLAAVYAYKDARISSLELKMYTKVQMYRATRDTSKHNIYAISPRRRDGVAFLEKHAPRSTCLVDGNIKMHSPLTIALDLAPWLL